MSLLEELVDSKRLEDIYNRVSKYAKLSEDTIIGTLKFPEYLYKSLMLMTFENLKWGISKSDLYLDGDSKGKAREFAFIYDRMSLGQALCYAKVRQLELKGAISEEVARDLRALIYLKYEKEEAKKVIAKYKEKAALEKLSKEINEINDELDKYGIVNGLINFNANTDDFGQKGRG